MSCARLAEPALSEVEGSELVSEEAIGGRKHIENSGFSR